MQNQPMTIPKVAKLDATVKHTDIQDEVITNNDFFPTIRLLEVRNAMRIDGTVTNERLKHAIIEAMATVNFDLRDFRKKHQANGKRSLEDCDDEEINGTNLLEYQYKRAVYSLATANLYERYRSFDSTKDGNDKADELLNTSGDLRRDYHFAVRDMLGTQRLITELI